MSAAFTNCNLSVPFSNLVTFMDSFTYDLVTYLGDKYNFNSEEELKEINMSKMKDSLYNTIQTNYGSEAPKRVKKSKAPVVEQTEEEKAAALAEKKAIAAAKRKATNDAKKEKAPVVEQTEEEKAAALAEKKAIAAAKRKASKKEKKADNTKENEDIAVQLSEEEN